MTISCHSKHGGKSTSLSEAPRFSRNSPRNRLLLNGMQFGFENGDIKKSRSDIGSFSGANLVLSMIVNSFTQSQFMVSMQDE